MKMKANVGYNSAPISVFCLGYSKKFIKWDQLHVTSLHHNQQFTGEGLMILACILCNGMKVVVDEMIYNYTLPVNSRKFHTYPLLESAETHALIPHFVGVFGMYWIQESCPLKPIILSSIEMCFDGEYSS